jgi:hypothetical protein
MRTSLVPILGNQKENIIITSVVIWLNLNVSRLTLLKTNLLGPRPSLKDSNQNLTNLKQITKCKSAIK